MEKFIRAFIFVVIFLNLMAVYAVSAANIGIKPKELNLKVSVGAEAKAEILVFNSGEEPALYKVSPDFYSNKISVAPNEFRLEPGGSQVVIVKIKTWIPKNFSTNISAVSMPFAAGNMPAAAGVKIPITVAVSVSVLWRILGAVIGVCFLVFVVVKLKKRRVYK